jgi:hypothetical protein
MKVDLDVVDRGESYKIRPGSTVYVLKDGVEVTLKEPTIDLVEEADAVKASNPIWLNRDICKVICNDFPKDKDLKNVSMRMFGHIVADFFLLLTGIGRRQSES